MHLRALGLFILIRLRPPRRSMRPHSYLLSGLGAFLLLLSGWLVGEHSSSAWVKSICQAINTPPQVALRSQVAGLLKAGQFDRAILKSARPSVVRAAIPLAPAQGEARLLAAIQSRIVAHLPREARPAYAPLDDVAMAAPRRQPAVPPPKSSIV
jgi:hypothetical protein